MSRILIIDDDADLRKALKIVLESNGYEVAVASSGEQGIEKIKTVKADLIILDVMMEEGDKGFDVARKIKKIDKYKGIPILMLTAVREKTGLDFKEEAGDTDWLPVDDYAEKPISPEDLIAKVEGLLKKK